MRCGDRCAQVGALSNDYVRDLAEAEEPVADNDLNSGISVVMPIVEIMDFLHVGELRQAREARVAMRRKIEGHRQA